MNNEEIVQDFRRRYEGTYVMVCAEQRGLKVLGKMNRIRADEERFATLEVTTRELGTIQMNMGSEEYQIKFEFPQPGIFQCGDQAVGFIRRAEKQYQRGLSAGNSRMLTATAGIVGNSINMDIVSVQAAFDHKTYHIGAALGMFKLGQAKSVALRDNYSVALPFRPSSTQHFIFHNYALVAACDDKGKLTRLYQPIHEKAITELLNG
jgi:hypothetical protein